MDVDYLLDFSQLFFFILSLLRCCCCWCWVDNFSGGESGGTPNNVLFSFICHCKYDKFHCPFYQASNERNVYFLWCLLQFRQNIFHFSSIHILYYLKGIYIYLTYTYIYLYLFISFFHWVAKDSSLQASDFSCFPSFFLAFFILYIYKSTFSCVWCFYALSVTTVMKSGKFKYMYFLFFYVQVLSI